MKNYEKPFKYSLNNDLKALVKKPSKIPGFNNFALNSSFNNLNEGSRLIKSSSKYQRTIYLYLVLQFKIILFNNKIFHTNV